MKGLNEIPYVNLHSRLFELHEYVRGKVDSFEHHRRPQDTKLHCTIIPNSYALPLLYRRY